MENLAELNALELGHCFMCHDPGVNETRSGHKPAILWLTGLSGSGKSTTAKVIERDLIMRHGCRIVVIDGDKLRRGLCSNLGFSSEDRMENIRRAAEVAKLFCQAGFIAIVSLISPLIKYRKLAREICAGITFIEVFVDCPLEICEERDVKGLYKKARAGEIKEFTGISAPYEKPDNPEIILRTYRRCVEDNCNSVTIFLQRENVIKLAV